MHVLTWNLRILHFCGVWRPRGWSSGWKKTLYGGYSTFVICFVCTFALSEIIAFALSIKNSALANNDLFFLLTNVGVCYKIGNTIHKRERIRKLIDTLSSPSLRARGLDETEIENKFGKRIKMNTLGFKVLLGITVSVITIDSFLVHIPRRSLPFSVWLPFDRTTELGFWIAFFHQTCAHILLAAITAAHDTLFHGLIIQTSSRLNMLKSKLRSIPKTIGTEGSPLDRGIVEKDGIGKCVRFHEEIFEFVKRTNDIFDIVIFMQYCVSTLVICMSTYTLTRLPFLSGEFFFLVLYLSSMLAEIHLLCWYGNEVITESIDVATAIYDMDWNSLKRNTKNDLKLIMARSLVPPKYKCGHFVTLSLHSYNNLLKFSYSMYHVLQEMSS